MIKKFFTINTLLYLALIMALVASLKHVAYAFSTTNGSDWIESYISAITIDLGLLALAAAIAYRARIKRSTWPMWMGVLLFSLISTYANWLSGIVHVTPITVQVGRLGEWLINLRPIILSAVLPILVIYLSEIVSHDHQADILQAEKEAQREARKQKQPANGKFIPGDLDSLELANEKRFQTMEERREYVAELLEQGLKRKEIIDLTGISSSTLHRDVQAINTNGVGK